MRFQWAMLLLSWLYRSLVRPEQLTVMIVAAGEMNSLGGEAFGRNGCGQNYYL